MDYPTSMKPYEFSKQFVFGVGVGLGLGLIMKRLMNDKAKHRETLIRTLQQLVREVQNLRDAIERTRRNTAILDRAASSNSQKEVASHESDDEDDDLFEMAPSDSKVEMGQDARDGAGSSTGKASSDKFLKEIASLQEGSPEDKEKAYNLLLSTVQEFPGHCEVMWRFARAQYDIATAKGVSGIRDEQEAFLKQGVESGGKAILIDDTSAAAHKWYAILLGSFSEFQPTQDKILMGYKYKEHIEKSIKLKDDDPSTYSLLGRWCYEVYMLPWYMRKAAAALYASPPSSTVDEALDNFLQAERLRPGFWKANTLYIGKCYYQKSDYTEAKEWLLTACSLPSKSAEDRKSHKEAEDLLAKL